MLSISPVIPICFLSLSWVSVTLTSTPIVMAAVTMSSFPVWQEARKHTETESDSGLWHLAHSHLHSHSGIVIGIHRETFTCEVYV